MPLQARAEDEAADGEELAADGEADGEGPVTSGTGLPWDGTDRDYHYEELLGKPAEPLWMLACRIVACLPTSFGMCLIAQEQ